MMYEDDIKKVDEWFSKHTEYYGTNHEGDEYTISEYDLEDFSKFLSDEFPDLCFIKQTKKTMGCHRRGGIK